MKTENKETSAPKFLRLTAVDQNGKSLGELVADAKEFSTGSKGFYASGKLVNPESGAKYQVSANIVLIGSGPQKKGGSK